MTYAELIHTNWWGTTAPETAIYIFEQRRELSKSTYEIFRGKLMYQGKYGNSDSLFGRQNRLIEYFDHLDSEEFDQEIKEDQEEE